MRWRKVWGNIFYIARDQFWPFILFWAAIFLMKLHPMSGLISLAFVNGEWAAQFWLSAGYSALTTFSVCVICGNIDLAMWFWFFGKGRFLLESKYPKAGEWFIKKFDPNRYEFSQSDNRIVILLKSLVFNLQSIFKKYRYTGLFLMGAAPFCGIIIGVPTAVGYKVKYGYWLMALGNTVKIVVFGFIIAHRILLAVFLALLLLLVFFHKPKTPLR